MKRAGPDELLYARSVSDEALDDQPVGGLRLEVRELRRCLAQPRLEVHAAPCPVLTQPNPILALAFGCGEPHNVQLVVDDLRSRDLQLRRKGPVVRFAARAEVELDFGLDIGVVLPKLHRVVPTWTQVRKLHAVPV